MTREELAALLRLLVDTGRLTAADAAELLRLFDAGDLDLTHLPVLPPLVDRPLTARDAAVALQEVAVRLPDNVAAAILTQATQPIQHGTPPAVRTFQRKRLRNSFRGDMQRTIARYAQAVAQGGDVATWQAAMQRELRAYYARQMTAGLGRPLTADEMARVGQMAVQQEAYLYRFAGEIAARRGLGRPLSLDYINARAQQYQAPGWAAWFEGNETVEARGDGYIVHYRCVDDPRSCGPCIDAENNGPYLPGQGPYPGTICRGQGHCRCERETVFDMEAWQRLTERAA